MSAIERVKECAIERVFHFKLQLHVMDKQVTVFDVEIVVDSTLALLLHEPTSFPNVNLSQVSYSRH